MPGIASYGAYVPLTRLPLALIAGRTASEGGPEKAVADYDEDAVTMALAAAIDCLGDVDRGVVDGLLFASTTYPLREKQGAALIAKALDLRRDVSTADHAGSLRAGTAALESALHAVAAGAARNVLVVASDCRMGTTISSIGASPVMRTTSNSRSGGRRCQRMSSLHPRMRSRSGGRLSTSMGMETGLPGSA